LTFALTEHDDEQEEELLCFTDEEAQSIFSTLPPLDRITLWAVSEEER